MQVVFYSNCQCQGLIYFLKDTIKDASFEVIYNYSLISKKNIIPVDILNKADLFIYQPIDKKHGIYSTDKSVKNNIMTHLPEHCKCISYPYIYNSSLWPLIAPSVADGYVGDYPGMNKYINSEPIEKLKQEGYSLENVISMFMTGNIDFNYEERFKNCMNILRKKEENCDVKVADFIEENIKKHKLFFTQNHPTSYVFVHCVNQVLEILGYENKYDVFGYPRNIVNLPGIWKHTTHDIKYWKFDYHVKPYNKCYIGDIRKIYENYEC